MEINLQNELLKREAILKEQEDRIIERDNAKKLLRFAQKELLNLILR